jgi:hypothetical protein
MKTCWFVVVEASGAWWVDCEGRAYGPLASKSEALDYARTIAVTYGDPRRRSDVWAANGDGKFELVWSGPPPAAEAAGPSG